jgi:hypothetical protein
MFTSTGNKGFQLTFKNKLTISVQFGKGNYCERRHQEDSTYIHEAASAEVMMWDEIGFEIKPMGWQNSEEVAELIHLTKNARDLADLSTKVTQFREQSA